MQYHFVLKQTILRCQLVSMSVPVFMDIALNLAWCFFSLCSDEEVNKMLLLATGFCTTPNQNDYMGWLQ